MSDQEPQAPSTLVKDQQQKPCGCVIITMSDDTEQITPCVPCGLIATAESLQRAAGAIGAVGQRLRIEHNQAVMGQVAQAVAKSKPQ